MAPPAYFVPVSPPRSLTTPPPAQPLHQPLHQQLTTPAAYGKRVRDPAAPELDSRVLFLSREVNSGDGRAKSARLVGRGRAKRNPAVGRSVGILPGPVAGITESDVPGLVRVLLYYRAGSVGNLDRQVGPGIRNMGHCA